MIDELDRPPTEYCATEPGRDLAVAKRTPIRGPQEVKRVVIEGFAVWRIRDTP